MRTFKYNQHGHSLDEMPTMEKPIWNPEKYTWQQFIQADGEYLFHFDSLLKSILLSGQVDWEDGKMVELDKDFELLNPCTCHPMCKHPFGDGSCRQRNEGKPTAIPLFTNKIKNMNKIPTQLENPNGLHGRYFIQKVVKKTEQEIRAEEELAKDKALYWIDEYKLAPTDESAEYFVMRLDEGGKDINHIKACRIGVHAYAMAIEHHLPELAKDLKERYPLL